MLNAPLALKQPTFTLTAQGVLSHVFFLGESAIDPFFGGRNAQNKSRFNVSRCPFKASRGRRKGAQPKGDSSGGTALKAWRRGRTARPRKRDEGQEGARQISRQAGQHLGRP